ncbi:MAG: flagellar biosynthetic protein FliO [Planctomycetes bacterium]|nr:flagellar biosynthetic protein FliO [Planctomycetota bacterium]
MDGRIPHLLLARVAGAVIALGSIPAIAVGQSVDPESQPVLLRAVENAQGTSGGGWISLFAVCMLAGIGAVLWWKGNFRSRSRRNHGSGAIEIIDRTVMAKGQSLTLVKVGDRVVLLGQSSQGFQRLAEFEASAPQETSVGAAHRRVA